MSRCLNNQYFLFAIATVILPLAATGVTSPKNPHFESDQNPFHHPRFPHDHIPAIISFPISDPFFVTAFAFFDNFLFFKR